MRKILIVNGLESAVEEEKNMLSNRNFAIFTATSSEEALAIHKREKVDLIIADIGMHGMSGETFFSLIKKDKTLGKVPVLITCNNEKSHLKTCAHWGAAAYITRPLDPDRFLRKVRQLIDAPKRSGARVLMNICVRGTSGNENFFCNSVDINTSGILIESDRAISEGDAMTCSLFIPGSSHNVIVECVVMRAVEVASNIYHYGAKFLNLGPRDKVAIEEFVRKKTR